MFGVYFHIPFCDTKCVYCDFYSLTNREHEVRFYNALEKEIRLFYKNYHNNSPITSVFFGGGTPSLADPKQLQEYIHILSEYQVLSETCEITFEANPGTMSSQKMEQFLSSGLNRISMGVQSFFDDDLKFLSRIHSAQTAKDAVLSAKKSGFQNISIDLIFGLPGQSLDDWKRNLDVALELPITHLSCYHLIVEEKTPLFHWVSEGKVKIPEDEISEQMYETTIEILGDAGFVHYEVSNFAKSGYEAKHNLTYWMYKPYLAFGPSAHGFYDRKRVKNIRSLGHYLQSLESEVLPIESTEIISDKTALDELLMLGVRTLNGVNIGPFIEILSTEEMPKLLRKLNEFEKNGYLRWENGHLSATPKGLKFGDYLAEELIP